MTSMISCLMRNTSLSTLQVKLMWVGDSRAKSNGQVVTEGISDLKGSASLLIL